MCAQNVPFNPVTSGNKIESNTQRMRRAKNKTVATEPQHEQTHNIYTHIHVENIDSCITTTKRRTHAGCEGSCLFEKHFERIIIGEFPFRCAFRRLGHFGPAGCACAANGMLSMQNSIQAIELCVGPNRARRTVAPGREGERLFSRSI